MSKQKTIYISGKMGEKVLSRETRRKFEIAQYDLTEEGWKVCNPACHMYQREMQIQVEKARQRCPQNNCNFDTYTYALLYDMHSVAACDAIYMLKDWYDSLGATAEFYYAKACGKEIVFEK